MFASRLLSSAIASAILIAFAPTASAQDAEANPPNRVARLAYENGDVEFAPAGADAWGTASVNRPMVTGDQVQTGPNNSRAELDLGDATLELNGDSAFNVLDIDSNVAQFELSQGTLSMRVNTFGDGQTYEVDTPTFAFVANQAGSYRVGIAPDGTGSTLVVYAGAGTVYGENGASVPVTAGRSYVFEDAALTNVRQGATSAADAFDRFCIARAALYEHSVSRQYVSPNMIGYSELDANGDWRAAPEYGEVWYPRVAAGWAPYHDGHWVWVDPWGWTWVDNAAWGFAPSHYGRWAYVENRWGWIPGPPTGHVVYAPALVAFVGGSGFSIGIGGGEPVGWFALGPRDVYMPPYHVTRDYFTNINVTNVRIVNNTTINNVYINYSSNKPGGPIVYGNRNVPGAVTVVPRSVFIGARPVAGAALTISAQQLAQAKVTPVIRVAPGAESLGARPGAHAAAGSPSQTFAHPIVARRTPPAPSVPFAERVKAIASQGGAPLAPTQMKEMRQAQASQRHAPARVVMAAPGGGKVAATHPVNAAATGPKSAAPAATKNAKAVTQENPKPMQKETQERPANAQPVAGEKPHAMGEPAQKHDASVQPEEPKAVEPGKPHAATETQAKTQPHPMEQPPHKEGQTPQASAKGTSSEAKDTKDAKDVKKKPSEKPKDKDDKDKDDKTQDQH